MCGIVGILTTKPTKKTRDAFKMMLFFDTVRGVHSTGVIGVDKDGNRDWYKKAVQAADFSYFPKAKEILDNPDNVLLIGHNRAATVGKVNDENAHPFEHGNIVGVHNGTLRTRTQLDDYNQYPVDSDNLYYHLSKHGIQKTTPKLNGAFTLVWHDKSNNSLNLVRNKERPMWMAPMKNGEGFVFASEKWMFQIACAKHGIELLDPRELTTLTHLKILIDKFPEDTAVKTKKCTEFTYNTSYNYSNQKWKGSSAGNTGTEASKVPVNYHTGEELIFTPTLVGSRGAARNNTTIHYVTGNTAAGKRVRAIVSEELATYIRKNLSRIRRMTTYFTYYEIQGEEVPQPQIIYVGDSRKDYKLDFYQGASVSSIGKGSAFDDDIPFEEDDKDVVIELINGPDGTKISMKKFKDIIKCGCAMCASPITPEEYDKVTWYSDDAVLCTHCSDLKS